MSDYKQEIENLMATVIKEGASDLHLSVGHRPSIRVAGSLLPLVNLPVLTEKDTEGLIEGLLAPELFQEFLQKKESDFSYMSKAGTSGEIQARFRGNAFY